METDYNWRTLLEKDRQFKEIFLTKNNDQEKEKQSKIEAVFEQRAKHIERLGQQLHSGIFTDKLWVLEANLKKLGQKSEIYSKIEDYGNLYEQLLEFDRKMSCLEHLLESCTQQQHCVPLDTLVPLEESDLLEAKIFRQVQQTVQNGDVEGLRQVIDDKTMPDSGKEFLLHYRRFEHGWSVIHSAASGGHIGMIEFLIELAGGDRLEMLMLESKVNGDKPIHVAIEHRKERCALEMLDIEPQLATNGTITNDDGFNLLQLAARFNLPNLAGKLISKYKMDRDLGSDESKTPPLVIAGQNGSLETLMILLNQGANIAKVRASDRLSVLHAACKSGHFEIVEKIVTMEPQSLSWKDGNGRLPIYYSIESHSANGQHDQIVEFLISKSKLTQLIPVVVWVVHFGRLTALELLYQRKVIERGEWIGLLYTAVERKHAAVADFIMNFIATDEQSLKVLRHCSLLHLASANGLLEVVKRLVQDFNVDVGAKAAHGETALMQAVKHDRYKVAEFLLSCGAPVDVCDNSGRNLMQLADEIASNAMVEMLSKAKGNTHLVRQLFHH